MREPPQMDTTDVVLFEVEGLALAVGVEHVRAVLRGLQLTPLPEAPELVEGVFLWKGTLVPVLSVHARLGGEIRPMRFTDHLIIVELQGILVALHVDRALDCGPLEPTSVKQEDVVVGKGAVRGVVETASGLLLIQDIEAFMSREEHRRLADLLSLRSGS